jgi:hypothetical protein
MATHIIRTTLAAAICVLGPALALSWDSALAAEITVGAPALVGTDTYVIHDATSGNDITIKVRITSAIITATDPVAAKQSQIIQAALAAGVGTSDVFASAPGKVKLIGYSRVSQNITSGEATVLAYGNSFSDLTGPSVAALDYEFQPGFTTLSGLDANGGTATYTAGFSFTDSVVGNVALSSTLSYAQLTTPSIAGLLTQEFNILDGELLTQAPGLAGILSLDLPNSSIDINFPTTVSDATVTNSAFDVALVETGNIGTVPEPPSWSIVVAGVALAGVMSYRRKRPLRGPA